MKTAFQYGQEAHSNGIHRICEDQSFMSAFCNRPVGNAMPYMKEWKNGWRAANEKEFLAKFPKAADPN